MSLHVVAGQPLVYQVAAINRATGLVQTPDVGTVSISVLVNGAAAAGTTVVGAFVANQGNAVTFTPTTPFAAGDKVFITAQATFSGATEYKLDATVAISDVDAAAIYNYFATPPRPDIFKDGSSVSGTGRFRWV